MTTTQTGRRDRRLLKEREEAIVMAALRRDDLDAETYRDAARTLWVDRAGQLDRISGFQALVDAARLVVDRFEGKPPYTGPRIPIERLTAALRALDEVKP